MSDEIQLLGSVAFPGVFESLAAPFVNDVKMWALPAKRVFESYLDGVPMENGHLERLWDENGSMGEADDAVVSH